MYRLLKIKKGKKSKIEKVGDYKTEKAAFKKQSKVSGETRIILLPENIKVGTKIYKQNQEHYATITRESSNFWFLKRVAKENDDEHMFMKETFLEKYEQGMFKVLENEKQTMMEGAI